MNIIKFKDTITNSEFFNENLKGKYAIAFHFQYVFPLGTEHVSENSRQIIYIEQNDIKEYPAEEISVECLDGEIINFDRNIDYVLFSDYQDYIEPIETLDKYIYLNNFTTDEDITIDELKRFRTWLAETLYINQEYIQSWSKDPDKHNNMLVYYIQEMYDEVVKSLTRFNNYVDISSITKQSGCGCGNSAVVYTSDVLSICDPLLIYRHNIYKYMIEIFSDITYWTGQVEICEEMKKYIDNIIKTNLPLSSVTLYSNFADCTCLNADANEQEAMMNILKRLSYSLEYIITGEVSGNRNYISSAFLDWSTYLYEKMRW